MGRRQKELDMDLMLELITDGMSTKDVAATVGCSIPTVLARIEGLKKAESALLAYDKTHYLDLICVKQKLLAGITDDKIDEAPLQHIAGAYGIVSKMEQLIQGRPTEIHGLMGYLLHIEKEDLAEQMTKKGGNGDEAIDVTPTAKQYVPPEQLTLGFD